MNSNGNRFTPDGDWRPVEPDSPSDLVREVQEVVGRSLRCEHLEDTPHISVPGPLRAVPGEFSPIALSRPPVVDSVRESASERLTDFLGSAQATDGDYVPFLATLQHEGEGRYSLWSPVSLVP